MDFQVHRWGAFPCLLWGMPTHTLTTEPRPLDDLRPHPSNPRNGDTEAIAASLQENGQYRPIVTTTDGTILAGNHTYMAALELGWGEIACVTLDVDPHSAEAHRIMLADNRTADLGNYDEGLLLALLTPLAEDGALLGTGFDEDALETLLRLQRPVGEEAWAAALGEAGGTEPEHTTMTVTLTYDQHETLLAAVERACEDGAQKGQTNPNRVGNAVAFMAAAYLQGRDG